MGAPYDPQTAANLLASLVGRFQSTQAPSNQAIAGALLLSPSYSGATAASQTTGSTAGRNQGTPSWLFSISDLEGYQTGGAGLTLQSFAVTAYQASQKAR